jgi:hypothetical protein
MTAERISHSIGSDVEKFKQLLSKASDDRELFVKLVKDPVKELTAAGVDLGKYQKSADDKHRIEEDLRGIMQGIIGGEIVRRLKGIVAETSYSRNTETSYEYNFDKSSSTDYKYESHTGSSRGTFSETSTGEATDTNTGYNGIALNSFEQLMVGPLISEKLAQHIQVQFQKTLQAAAQVR